MGITFWAGGAWPSVVDMLYTAMKTPHSSPPPLGRCWAAAFSLCRGWPDQLRAALCTSGSCFSTSSTSRRPHPSYRSTRRALAAHPNALPPPPTRVCVLLPVRSEAWREYGLGSSLSTSRRRGRRPGLAAWPSWLRRPSPALAGCVWAAFGRRFRSGQRLCTRRGGIGVGRSAYTTL